MSNQACLFAEDTPTPYDPFTEEDDPLANTMPIAAAVYQVPAFWLFCFDKDSLVEIESEEGNIPGLVGEMSTAHALLIARQEVERLAAQIDWDRAPLALRPQQAWYNDDNPFEPEEASAP